MPKRVLDYAVPRPRERRQYAAPPRTVILLNVASLVAGLLLWAWSCSFEHTLGADFVISILVYFALAPMMLLLQFFFSVLPTFRQLGRQNDAISSRSKLFLLMTMVGGLACTVAMLRWLWL